MSGPESINSASTQGSVPMLMQLISQINNFQKSTSEFQALALSRFAAIEARQEHFEKSLSELRAAILPPQRPPSPLIDIMTVDSPVRPAPKQDVMVVTAEVNEQPAPEKNERKAKSKAKRLEPETKTNEETAVVQSKPKARRLVPDAKTDSSSESSEDAVEITSIAPTPLTPVAQIVFPKLRNFANTCHINSAINLIFQLPSLVKLLENEKNENPIKLSLLELYKVYRTGNEQLINTKLEEFINVLVPNSKELQLQNGQKDADVALRYILDALEYVVPYQEVKYVWQANRKRTVYRFEEGKETVFALQMMTKTLNEMFTNSFFSIYENNDENMKWAPSAHDTPMLDWKRRKFFVKPPEVLFINYQRGGIGGKKVLENIPYEKEFTLPISLVNTPFQVALGKDKIEERGQAKYRLAGVIMHLGMNMRGGHFCNYLPKDGEWYRVSDDASELLKKLEDNSARKNEVSYILAYEKIPE